MVPDDRRPPRLSALHSEHIYVHTTHTQRNIPIETLARSQGSRAVLFMRRWAYLDAMNKKKQCEHISFRAQVHMYARCGDQYCAF